MSAPVKQRAAAKKRGSPAWVKCPCGEWLCTIHAPLHAFDCSCPAVNEWPAGTSPYCPMTEAQKQKARAANP